MKTTGKRHFWTKKYLILLTKFFSIPLISFSPFSFSTSFWIYFAYQSCQIMFLQDETSSDRSNNVAGSPLNGARTHKDCWKWVLCHRSLIKAVIQYYWDYLCIDTLKVFCQLEVIILFYCLILANLLFQKNCKRINQTKTSQITHILQTAIISSAIF